MHSPEDDAGFPYPAPEVTKDAIKYTENHIYKHEAKTICSQ